MKFKIYFREELENDLTNAFFWYESKSKGLGYEFLRMFEAAAGLLSQMPLINKKSNSGFRRILISRFPFSIYYTLDRKVITVYGAFHCARDPRDILKNVSARTRKSDK